MAHNAPHDGDTSSGSGRSRTSTGLLWGKEVEGCEIGFGGEIFKGRINMQQSIFSLRIELSVILHATCTLEPKDLCLVFSVMENLELRIIKENVLKSASTKTTSCDPHYPIKCSRIGISKERSTWLTASVYTIFSVSDCRKLSMRHQVQNSGWLTRMMISDKQTPMSLFERASGNHDVI